MSTTAELNPTDVAESSTAKTHFDLHVNGIGYLNRIREVKVKKGSFWACTIAALHGSIDEPETTYFDCKIEGAEALDRVRFLKSAVDAQRKVTVSFRVSDIYPESFVYQSGARQGETGITIKGRLLKIGSAKIDGLPVDFAEMRFAA
ncbi:MAG: DUF3577 domain-containing protein [Hydrogenophilales bacterium]|nr:DUF3577 domain-containing protein [Hydrogenophilales bacterium]